MSIYRVEKKEQAVVLFQADGSIMKGVVFLSASAYSHMRQQTLLDLLKEKEPFFPFRSTSGDFSIANRHTITHIRYGAPLPEEEVCPLGTPEDVQITFVGGEQLRGTIIIDLPDGRQRLIDYFNAAEGYFEMQTEESCYLVNAAQVRDVCPA